LVFYVNESGKWTLSYKLDVLVNIAERWVIFINAKDGSVVHQYKNFHSAGTTVASSGVGAFGSSQSFTAWSEDGTYYMVDPSFPLNDPVHDPIANQKSRGDTYILDARNGESGLFFSTSTSANSGCVIPPLITVVISRD
jgi:Zn-dependent metalloprotease